MHNNFLMGVKFGTSWRNFREFSKSPSWREFLKNGLKSNFLEKVTVVVWFWKFLKISPTCPKFNTHKKVVLHFFIPMLLLPKTPPSTYLKTKKIKDQKITSLSLFHFSLFTFTSHTMCVCACVCVGGERAFFTRLIISVQLSIRSKKYLIACINWMWD